MACLNQVRAGGAWRMGAACILEGEEQPMGMLRVVFMELCEMMVVQKWARADM